MLTLDYLNSVLTLDALAFVSSAKYVLESFHSLVNFSEIRRLRFGNGTSPIWTSASKPEAIFGFLSRLFITACKNRVTLVTSAIHSITLVVVSRPGFVPALPGW